MTRVRANQHWPVLLHAATGMALAFGAPTLTVWILGQWDPMLGPGWAWSFSAFALAGLAMVASLSFAVGMNYAPAIATSDQPRLTVLGPSLLLLSVCVAVLEQRVWMWLFLAVGQGLFAMTALYFAVKLDWLMPATLEPRCAACGYLLHGLHSSRCPECGEMVRSETEGQQ